MKVVVHTIWPVRFWECPASQVECLQRQFPEVTFVHARSDAEGLEAIRDADVAFSSSLTAEMARRAEKLRWVHSTAAAVGYLPLADLSARGVLVTNSKAIQAIPIAEHVMAGLLLLARRLDMTLQAQRERRWIQNDFDDDAWPWTLHGRSMTIVGLGSIGQEVARRANAFGMKVTGVRRRPDQPVPPYVSRTLGPDRLQDALSGCDVLVISAPFLPATNRLIGAAHLALLNPGAVVANVARGQIVDEKALIDALQWGRLRGAVLDVFDREPLDTASPLWNLPNVVITPHCSGFRADHWNDVIDLFSRNLRRFQRGERLLNPVDCDAGY